MKKVVIASNNAGKLREIARILEPLAFEAVPQSAFGVPECPEPHVTFVENCIAKARHAAAHTGLPALADDSGICVDALNGAPGVYSARYAGEPKSDERNNQKLIEALQGEPNRRAHYYCVMVYVRYADDYDPYFLVPEFGQTGAELSMEIKNGISHRGQALRALAEKLSA